jgi:hypothetical protein
MMIHVSIKNCKFVKMVNPHRSPKSRGGIKINANLDFTNKIKTPMVRDMGSVQRLRINAPKHICV